MHEQEKFHPVPPLLLCIYTGFLLLPVVVSQIPLSSKLSVVENNFWVSSNGDFALGFFNHCDQPKQFSVGIHFNSHSIPIGKRTVVWVAGADLMVGNKSYFQLTLDGELVLFDSSKGVIAWSSKTTGLLVASAVLRDDGNFVLLGEKKDVVWQSFDTPSDTLLPGQNLSILMTLRAASKNSVSSYYSLHNNASGQLQLRWESDVIYWRSGSPSSSNLSAVLTSDGALQLLDQGSKPVWSALGEDHGDFVKFRFLRLDVDGNLRLYSWEDDSQSWKSVWQAVENQCNVFATCGNHGICFSESESAVCKCPFKFTSEEPSKCLAPYVECKSGSSMHRYEHTSLYGIYPPSDSVIKTSLQQCQRLCLKDLNCTAVTFKNDGTLQCQMKKTRYITGYSDPSVRSISFVKRCSDPFAADPHFPISSPPHSPLKRPYKICISCLIGAASGTIVVFAVVQLGIGFYIYKRRISIRKEAALSYTDPNLKGLIVLSFTEIKDLTGNFQHQIGPKTFKGMLPNNQPVAVKNVKSTMEERLFRNAVLKIGSIHHKNLVKLHGYCSDLGHRYLVYENVKNGSLEKYIEDSQLSKRLTWRKRVEICSSVARAICYLHTECREFINHGNLKCENVVLDENLEAKVTEFGLWRIQGEEHVDSAERDVKDFGKMVLILISGRREMEGVCEWAYKEWMEGQAETVIDERVIREVGLQELERLLRIAFWCLQIDERMRPSMGEVVTVLEGTLSVDLPPSPFAFREPPEEGSLDSWSEP